MSTIVVDHREQAPELCRALRGLYGYTLTFRTLARGDYDLGFDVVVERKTTRDFAVSLMDGRLFRQAWQLNLATAHPVLLIEGGPWTETGVGVTPAAIKGALVTLAQTFRLPVLRSRDQGESAWYLDCLYHQRRRAPGRPGPGRGPRCRTLAGARVRILRSLPGVGDRLAVALLREFGSVENVVRADNAALRRTPGIGAGRAAAIRRVLRDPPGRYASGELAKMYAPLLESEENPAPIQPRFAWSGEPAAEAPSDFRVNAGLRQGNRRQKDT